MYDSQEKRIEIPLYTTASIVELLNKIDSESLRWTLRGLEKDVDVFAADHQTKVGVGKHLVELSLTVAPGFSAKVFMVEEAVVPVTEGEVVAAPKKDMRQFADVANL